MYPCLPRFAYTGAGIGGIAAGYELNKAGLSYFIYEASSRVGGRLFGSLFGSGTDKYPIENGAQYIVGLTGNPFYELALEFGLTTTVQNFNSLQLHAADGRVNSNEGAYGSGTACLASFDAYLGVQRLGRFCYRPEAGEAFFNNTVESFCQDELGPNFEYADNDDISVMEGQILINGFLPSDFGNREAIARVCEYYNIDFEFGNTPDIVSVADSFPIATNVDFEAGSLFVQDPRGFKFLVEKYASLYLKTAINTTSTVVFNDFRLQMTRKIIKVEWDPTGEKDVFVTSCMTAGVTTADGDKLQRFPCLPNPQGYHRVRAKQFISTFSLGVLKESRQMEIDLGYTGGDTIDLATTRDRAPLFDPPLSSIPILSGAIETLGFGYSSALYLQFENQFWPNGIEFFLSAHSEGGYTGDFAPIWTALDTGFPGFSLDGSNMLSLTVTGARSLELNMLTDAEIIEEILPVLNSMFNQNLSPSDVLDIELTRWANDPLFRGMSPFDSVSASNADAFSAPYGNLYFSGEIACDRHGGWAHGAAFGGAKSAEQLLNRNYGGPVPTPSLCDFTAEELAATGRRLETEERYLRKGMKYVPMEEQMEAGLGSKWNFITNDDMKARFKEHREEKLKSTGTN